MTMQSVSGFTDKLDRTTNLPEYQCFYTSSNRMPMKCVMPQLEKESRFSDQPIPKKASHIPRMDRKRKTQVAEGCTASLKSSRGQPPGWSWKRRCLWASVMVSSLARLARHLASKAFCLEKNQPYETFPFCHPYCWGLLL